MDCIKPATTPAVSGIDKSEDCNRMEGVNFQYREAVGCVLYLSNKYRPDITYAVNMASRKAEKTYYYAGNMATSRITSGYVILYMVSPVAWFTRKQPIISLSTPESEFIAATECVKKVLFLNSLYKELTGEFTPANLNIDNKSTIQMIKNDSMTKRS
ncbi:hypothetical protein PR048_033755 [Dryococelus australis]|uniref:Uncharacterized protein n=1 Tax=Dryococelus australis TaxID=614101 RepID=A0ABQ9G3B8_9NEOP|nr:hypothetical protein PR048_033755 [Dryococelus australis]